VMNFNVMISLVLPEIELNRALAERIVKLFLSGGAPGAANHKRKKAKRAR